MADAKAAGSSSDGVVPNPKARLLDQVREGDPGQALFHSYRRSLRSMDQTVHFFSRQTASKGNGSQGNRSVSHGFGGAWKGRCLDAEPGIERAGFPLPESVAH